MTAPPRESLPNPPPLRVLDIFSGIGSFSLGLERTGGFETTAFCEIEPYPRKVLARNWPGIKIHGDVTHLDGRQYEGAIDVVCGGFPCQDISRAGRAAGLEGAKSGLWWQFHRIIAEAKPRYAVIENVLALRTRGLGTLLTSLDEIGYDAEWHCIPASAVGAPHRRDRLFILAYPRSDPADQGRALVNPVRLGDGLEEGPVLAGWDGAQHAGRWAGEPGMVRVADGTADRVDRLKCLGNTVIPQIAEFVGGCILRREASLAGITPSYPRP